MKKQLIKSVVAAFTALVLLTPSSVLAVGPAQPLQPATVQNPRQQSPREISDLGEEADRATFENVFNNSPKAKDISELAPFTSYLYVDKGFFGVEDPFPKIANAFVQGLFFLTKIIYILTTIILQTVFKAEVYQQLDNIVQFSGNLFEAFRDTWLTYILMALAFSATWQYIRRGKVPLSLFRFLGVMLLGMFLYSKSAIPNTDLTGNYQSEYNLSKLIRTLDTVSAELTASMLSNFDSLNSDNNFTDQGGQSLEKVTAKLFDELVYTPFLHLNFKNVNQVTQDQTVALFVTRGDKDKVKEIVKDYKELKPLLSFTYIGHKVLVALASLFKAIVIGFAVIILGLISLVFKLLALVMVVFSVFLFFFAMIPGLEHILGNAGKSLIQFIVIGGLGLVFVRGFLYLVTIIDKMVSSMADAYYWVAVLQGLVLYLMYRFRSLLLGIFSRGLDKAKELGERVQSQVSDVGAYLTSGGRNSSQYIYRPSGLNRAEDDVTPVRTPSPTRRQTLSRAGRNVMKNAANKAVDTYDNFRYGEGDTLEKGFVHEERQRNKQSIQDKFGHAKDNLVSVFTLEGVRNKVHDLAGDEETPTQTKYCERKQRQLERKQRREEERDQYIEFQQDRFDADRKNYKNYRRQLFEDEHPDLPSKKGNFSRDKAIEPIFDEKPSAPDLSLKQDTRLNMKDKIEPKEKIRQTKPVEPVFNDQSTPSEPSTIKDHSSKKQGQADKKQHPKAIESVFNDEALISPDTNRTWFKKNNKPLTNQSAIEEVW